MTSEEKSAKLDVVDISWTLRDVLFIGKFDTLELLVFICVNMFRPKLLCAVDRLQTLDLIEQFNAKVEESEFAVAWLTVAELLASSCDERT